MSNLTSYLLNLVHNPELAEQFRNDNASAIADANLTDEEKCQLKEMVAAPFDQAQSVTLNAGQFYMGDDRGTHIFVVSTTQQTVTKTPPADKNYRIELSDVDGSWPNPSKVKVNTNGNVTVYVEHLLNKAAPKMTGTITSLEITLK